MSVEQTVNPILIRQPIEIVKGELQFCLRQLNTSQSIRGYHDPLNNSSDYYISNSQERLVGSGDVGIITIWPVGNQTYLETRVLHAYVRESLGFVFENWFCSRGSWPDPRYKLPPAGYQLIEKLMTHIEEDRKNEIVFEHPMQEDVLEDFCAAIHSVVSAALHCDVEEVAEQMGRIRFIEGALYDWARGKYSQHNEPDFGLMTSVKKLCTRLLTDDSELENTIVRLSVDEQSAYQFNEIKVLLDQLVQLVYEKRMVFQQEIISALMERLGQYSRNDLHIPVVSQSESAKTPFWETIPNFSNHRTLLKLWLEGYAASQIAERLGIRSVKTVYRKLKNLRSVYGEEAVPFRRSDMPSKVKT